MRMTQFSHRNMNVFTSIQVNLLLLHHIPCFHALYLKVCTNVKLANNVNIYVNV